jgi:DNA-binding NarL/FixJ family response regulator
MRNGEKIKVLLVDEHRILCEGLRLLLDRLPDMEVLDGEQVGKNVVQLTRELKPDVVIIDLNMSETDNIEHSRRILSENPGVKIVALPTHLHVHTLEQAIRAGISGFVLKECDFDELVCAVRAVHENKTYMCRRIENILANGYLSQMRADFEQKSSSLSEREYEIIRLLSLGMTSKEIALRMEVSVKTIDASRRKILHKLKINSMAELVKHAIREGITSI